MVSLPRSKYWGSRPPGQNPAAQMEMKGGKAGVDRYGTEHVPLCPIAIDALGLGDLHSYTVPSLSPAFLQDFHFHSSCRLLAMKIEYDCPHGVSAHANRPIYAYEVNVMFCGRCTVYLCIVQKAILNHTGVAL